MISIGETTHPGEVGFGLSLFHQTSYGQREHGKGDSIKGAAGKGRDTKDAPSTNDTKAGT